MAAEIQTSILELYGELDSLAVEAYGNFSKTTRDVRLKETWRQLAADEAQHVRYWRLLLKSQADGLLPQVFDDPLEVYRRLENARDRMNELMAGLYGEASPQRMLLVACYLEFFFLDQSVLQLLRHIKALGGEAQPVEKYHDHLERFLAMVSAFGESDELKLVGETISRLWKDNRSLVDAMFLDPLTGLLNRRGFFTTATPLASLARRKGSTAAIVMIDIDRFRLINDANGRAVGDQILEMVGRIVRESFRGSDVIGRYGGEEFAVFFPEVDPDSLPALGEKVRANVESAGGLPASVTISVGIAHAIARKDEGVQAWLDALVKRADDALHNAKDKGRNSVVLSR